MTFMKRRLRIVEDEDVRSTGNSFWKDLFFLSFRNLNNNLNWSPLGGFSLFIHLFSNKHIVNRIFWLSKTSLSWNIALFVILKKCFPYLHVSNEIYTLCYQIIQGNDVFLMQPDCHNIMKINITLLKNV